MTTRAEIETRFAAFVEHHVLRGERLPLATLCDGRPELAAPLGTLVDRYLALTLTLAGPSEAAPDAPAPDAPLPRFDGFQTVERIGAGGMGEVFKLRDLRLDRIVAAKVVRRGGADRTDRLQISSARPRRSRSFRIGGIVQVFEYRPESRPAGHHHGIRGRLRAGPPRALARVSRSARGSCSTSARPCTTPTRSASSIAT